MFEFEYKIAMDDYVEFNMYHSKNSRTFKNSMLVITLLGPAIFITFALVYFGDLLGVSIFLVASIIWIAFIRKYMWATSRRRIIKFINEGDTSEIFELKKLIVNDDGVLWSSKTSEGKYNWNAIIKICDLEEHIYLYVSSIQAIIIPKNVIDENGEFIEYCKAKSGVKVICG